MNDKIIKFRKYCLQLVDAPQGYEWGKENPYGTDCSGTICYPLIRMGYKIRTTADALLKNIFTIPVADNRRLDKLMAVFYVVEHDWIKADGIPMKAGTARHVTPVVGDLVVLDADAAKDQIILKSADILIRYLETKGLKAEWREIDWEKADAISREGKMYYGPDPELIEFMKE